MIVIKFDGGKEMFATDMDERIRDQGKFPRKIYVFVFSNDINNEGNDFKGRMDDIGLTCGNDIL